MIKDVLIRDFSVFVNRGFRTFPEIEPLSQHLFLLEAERWRPLRAKLSPIFTSGKLKEMFPLIVQSAESLDKYLDQVAESGQSVECRDLAAKFTTDIIGSCAFGINMNALSDEESEFRRMGRQIFEKSLRQRAKNCCRQFSPFLYRTFGSYLQDHEVTTFFINLINDTVKYRKENNVSRPDFINMLMELQEHPEKIDNITQAFVFFIAGFETSSTTISFALYELAQNQDIQDKLREEIRETYSQNNGALTYEQLKGMKYLDKVFKETLRKYPVLSMLAREATENYSFRGTKISLPKKAKVWIPVYGIQTDPNIYPKPEVFDPERFDESAVAARHPMSYLPFGDGPRNCIGSRFAINQSKVGITTVIRNHRVSVCEKTQIPFVTDPAAFTLTLKGGVHLKISSV
ncbi:unnamed protein product [Xylocopa violacea]|uniref:Cytochrome P450 n=1 Tax=Xylocopa violacea TaxID=135666 RepID=A0ABP1PDZ0_XYLVO